MDALVVCMDLLQRAKTYFITFINNKAKKKERKTLFNFGIVDASSDFVVYFSEERS